MEDNNKIVGYLICDFEGNVIKVKEKSWIFFYFVIFKESGDILKVRINEKFFFWKIPMNFQGKQHPRFEKALSSNRKAFEVLTNPDF